MPCAIVAFCCRPIGDFLASKAAAAALLAERVCELGWAVNSTAALAVLEGSFILLAPASDQRMQSLMWLTAASASSSEDIMMSHAGMALESTWRQLLACDGMQPSSKVLEYICMQMAFE